MKTYAIIIGGVVVNICLWDGIAAWFPACDARIDITGTAVGVGWTWNGTTFTAPVGV